MAVFNNDINDDNAGHSAGRKAHATVVQERENARYRNLFQNVGRTISRAVLGTGVRSSRMRGSRGKTWDRDKKYSTNNDLEIYRRV